MDRSQLLGSTAEAECAGYLRAKGYKIIAMNYACRGGEIDIIAEQRRRTRVFAGTARGFIVFVEVKMRSRRDFGEPREAVTRRKQDRLRLAASMWLVEHDTDLQPRFDVIEVFSGERGQEFNHIENAFE